MMDESLDRGLNWPQRGFELKLHSEHLGIEVIQVTDNQPFGRPTDLVKSELLRWELAWIELFYGLRNGFPETKIPTRGASGILMRAKPDNEKVFVSSETETFERSGRETIYTQVAGQEPNRIKQPMIIDSDQEMRNWQDKATQTQENFERIATGYEPIMATIAAKPAERHVWETLKRAKTARQVRSAYNQSKIWLISRREFPGGGYQDWSWSPYPKALYRNAAQFCKAKLDPRYPGLDKRESGDYRRIEYLGRVMAGLSLPRPISASYSVEILRKMKHEQTCACWRCTCQIAPRFPRTLVQFLREDGLEMLPPT
jgi:hypothetical protein